ncbi:MAG: hypothetical protein ABI690_30735 [Chloroflexota bacterium]
MTAAAQAGVDCGGTLPSIRPDDWRKSIFAAAADCSPIPAA